MLMASQVSQQRGGAQLQTVTSVSPASTGTIRSIPLLIAGQRISVRTDQSEEYLNALAAEVNNLVDTLKQGAPQAGLPQIMALAAIQLADRAVSAENAVMQGNLKVEKHIERLSGILRTLEESPLQN